MSLIGLDQWRRCTWRCGSERGDRTGVGGEEVRIYAARLMSDGQLVAVDENHAQKQLRWSKAAASGLL